MAIYKCLTTKYMKWQKDHYYNTNTDEYKEDLIDKILRYDRDWELILKSNDEYIFRSNKGLITCTGKNQWAAMKNAEKEYDCKITSYIDEITSHQIIPLSKPEDHKSIDKVTTTNLDLALRLCDIFLSKDTVDIIIDIVELIEEKGHCQS